MDQALDFLSQELAQVLGESWEDTEDELREHAKNLILGEVDLDDNAISDDEEERKPSKLQKVYSENKHKFEIIKREHFLLLSAPITKKIRSQEAERKLRKFQYEHFCEASPLLQEKSHYTEVEVTHGPGLFDKMKTYMQDQKWNLTRSIIFNGHGHETKGFCLEDSGKRSYISLDRIKKKMIQFHEEFSVDSLKQETRLYFIQCWGHRHDPGIDHSNIIVFSYTTEKKPKTYNLRGGHSALQKLAKQHVEDINNAMDFEVDDTVAELMETDEI